MTAELQVPVDLDVPVHVEPALCPDCNARPPRNRWCHALPDKIPQTLGLEHIEVTFVIHPWLEDDPAGGLLRVLRDWWSA